LTPTARSRDAHQYGAPAGLLARADAKVAEVDQKLSDLQPIRDSLIEARDAGCDEPAKRAESNCCPLPFTPIDQRGHRSL
jgi:hypothetical protein